MDNGLVWGLRLGAIWVAFLAGCGYGSCLPGWKLDYFKEFGPYSNGSIYEDASPFGLFKGWSSLVIGGLIDLKSSCSSFALLNTILLAGGFVLAALGWPPIWQNPLQAHPVEYCLVLFFQRWIWITIGSCLAGMIASGAVSCLRVWFRR